MWLVAVNWQPNRQQFRANATISFLLDILGREILTLHFVYSDAHNFDAMKLALNDGAEVHHKPNAGGRVSRAPSGLCARERIAASISGLGPF